MTSEFRFACPTCGSSMLQEDGTSQICQDGDHRFRKVDGIWRFLPEEREKTLARFVGEYETVRRAEGRGSQDPAFYRQLPATDPSYRRAGEWLERAHSFRVLLNHVLDPLGESTPLQIVDVGAGNGWLSYQMARRGHCAVAIDLSLSEEDGLGAHVHYDAAFTSIQAEFDNMPLMDGQADLVLFNASFHYSEGALKTAAEAWRIVRSGGRMILIDTPIYHDRKSGEQMIQERQRTFRVLFGFPSDGLESEHFLTYERVAEISQALETPAVFLWPVPSWRRLVRRGRVWLRRQREPAQFPILIWQKQ